jgi:hypothetical protein
VQAVTTQVPVTSPAQKHKHNTGTVEIHNNETLNSKTKTVQIQRNETLNKQNKNYTKTHKRRTKQIKEK